MNAAPMCLLVKQMLILREISFYIFHPIGGHLSVIRLNDKYNRYSKCKNYCSNESPFKERSVSVGRFIFTVECLCATGNSAGKTILITLLKNYCNYDKCSRDEKQHKKYDFKNFHFQLPFKFYYSSSEHYTRKHSTTNILKLQEFFSLFLVFFIFL